ncbi:MAG: hypothetical protein JXR94_08025 [Candidatus Hydrogenedentes bacterium]|nr:hypothetical protein [Candidatus Hydrogenedentota bacterium]
MGFFGAQRFAAFKAALAGTGLVPAECVRVHDRGALYTPFVPDVERAPSRVKGLEDWLAGAQSVIVLGLHFPDTVLDTAKVTPAETTGPFAFVMYESLRLLSDAAMQVVKRLKDTGYRAVLATDLTGLASQAANPRGRQVDLRGNRFAAVLAGLGTIGLHGHVLTPEFGVRQRFLAIVTDCPIPDSPLCTAPSACAACDKDCLDACPTRAIQGDTVPLTVGGVQFDVPRVAGLACDWAKLYGLSGEAGAKYLGLGVDVPVPDAPSGADVAKAAASAEFGVQKRLLSLAEECVRVCPAHKAGG